MHQTTVVLPTYNEAENLPLIVEELLVLPLHNLRVLIVDDNSPDGTGELADHLTAQYPKLVTVIHRSQKAGLGPAYIAGFKAAVKQGADYIVQMDADFSHQPKYLLQMIAAAEYSDLVIGSRYVNGGSVDKSWGIFRKALSWFANRVYVPTLLRIPVRDTTAGYRLWRQETLLGIDLDKVRSNGYAFLIELLYLTYKAGFRITEIPIYFPDRQKGRSKMDFKVASEAVFRVWEVLYRSHRSNSRKRPTENNY
ncbi:MAG: polyprenol monophosphomannose synthase [Anaerolineales bacterium]